MNYDAVKKFLPLRYRLPGPVKCKETVKTQVLSDLNVSHGIIYQLYVQYLAVKFTEIHFCHILHSSLVTFSSVNQRLKN